MDKSLLDRLDESPVYFRANGETLLGILTTPKYQSSKTAVIVLTGRGFPSPNRNRLSVHLCRCLAELGFSALRFDYHGIGESTGVAEGFDLSKPFVHDLDGAITHLKGDGFDKFVLIGSCFGARTALSLGPTVTGLAGLILIAVPLHEDAGAELAFRLSSSEYVRRALRARTLRRLFQAQHRERYLSLIRSKLAILGTNGRNPSSPKAGASRTLTGSFSRSLEAILARKVPVLFIYGSNDRYYHQFKRASELGLGDLLNDGRELLTVTELDGNVHGFTNIEAQAEVIEVTSSWLQDQVMNQRNRRPGE
jgi:pimeloyl-ACP methyl ester carboxylesterase